MANKKTEVVNLHSNWERNTKTKIIITIGVFAFIISLFSFALMVFNTDNTSVTSALSVEGNIAYIGEYPQTICTDDEVIAALDLLTPQTDGYYYYNGECYAKCSTEVFSEGGGKYSDESTPVNGEIKYFKVESLKWFVIKKDEKMMMLVSYQIVDTHAWQTQFVGDTHFDCKITVPDGNGGTKQLDANDWKYSELRSWLDTTFYDTAFSADDKKSVLKVTTPAEKTASDVSTDGFVNILSRQDFEANKARIKDTGVTDYAIAQGLY